jgi:hypothetical protein
MSDTASAIYLCDSCGTVAGSIELENATHDQLCLRVVGPVGETRYFLDAEVRRALLPAMRTQGSLALYELKPEYAPFFCPVCGRNYCRNCWRMTTIFDDDFPGWYDSTEGYCREGHRRLLDD